MFSVWNIRRKGGGCIKKTPVLVQGQASACGTTLFDAQKAHPLCRVPSHPQPDNAGSSVSATRIRTCRRIFSLRPRGTIIPRLASIRLPPSRNRFETGSRFYFPVYGFKNSIIEARCLSTNFFPFKLLPDLLFYVMIFSIEINRENEKNKK